MIITDSLLITFSYFYISPFIYAETNIMKLYNSCYMYSTKLSTIYLVFLTVFLIYRLFGIF